MPAAPLLAAGLAVTSVLLAAPVSGALATVRWTRRAPRASLVLWQAVCLSAGLCLVGAGVVLAFQPLGDTLLSAVRTWFPRLLAGHPLAGMTGHGIVAGTVSLLVALILFGVLVRSAVLTARRRRAHRMVLDLLTGTTPPLAPRGNAASGQTHRTPAGADPGLATVLADVRILDHPTAVAYTLPGWHSRIVLSAGMLDLLNRAELAAVIDHERAHVRSRHDLLVLPFQAWATAVGWLPGVRAAGRSVAELTEMLADDWAAHRSTPDVLARALAMVALAGVPGESGVAGSQTPAVAGRAVSARVERLRRPERLPLAALICVYGAAAVLLALPVVPLVVGWR